jgi:hypothetical protein
MSTEPASRRVVVTSMGTRAVRPSAGSPAGREIDEQTRVGEVLVRSLIRAQLRLALYFCALAAILVGGLPVLFHLLPWLVDFRLLHVPLPWLLLGLAVYPAVCLGAWAYVRTAERNERDFTELVDRS